MTDEELKSFCAGREDLRTYLQAPWRAHGWLWATNGHLLVRIADDGRACAEQGQHPPKVNEMMAGVEESAFAPLPQLAPPVACEKCDGSGRVGLCDECDEGEFDHGSHTYECKECRGSGIVEGDDEACIYCDGTGESCRSSTDVGASRFATHYLRRLAKLPGFAFDPREHPKAGVFRFDGGYGLLMPVRRD